MAKFNSKNNCLYCKKKCHLFSLLTNEELSELQKQKHEVHFDATETIFKQGTYTNQIVSLNSGLAKKYIEGIDGKKLILSIIKPTQVVFWPGMFIDNRHHFSLSAIAETHVCFIEIDLFKQLMNNNVAFNREALKEYSIANVSTFDLMINLTQKQMHGRLADSILHLSNDIFQNDSFDILLSRQELADMSGISKESTCRILKELKTEKIIDFRGNKFNIINKEHLRSISKTG